MRYILDRNKPHQKFFEEISRIPRMSFREQAVSDYIAAFAKERELWFHQDPLGNVIVKKSGIGGCSQIPVMLQAHLDMVCEKEPESDFDFKTDPIKLIAEDGWVSAQGTTLGADDGAGVALILAVLDQNDRKHPPLECIFTVQEEDGMGGALNLDYSKLTARRLIALDGLEEGTSILSTTGVYSGYIIKEIQAEPNSAPAYLLRISGLRGGHAALNIGKGQGNAIKIAAEILSEVNSISNVRLASINGGTILNGIPQTCEAVFTPSENVTGPGWVVQRAADKILAELGEKDPDLSVDLKPQNESVLSMAEGPSREVIRLICSLPAGVRTWHTDIPGFPAASRNLGTVSTEKNKILIGYSCRGTDMSEVLHMAEETGRTAKDHHASYQKKFQYPGYSIEDNSPLIRIWSDVYRESTGKELILRQIHSGTDAGTIAERMGGMDIIVLMPNTLDVHTPAERMELASFNRTCAYLFIILERLAMDC